MSIPDCPLTAGYVLVPIQPLPVWCLRCLQGAGFALYVTSTLAWLGQRVPAAKMGRFLGVFGLTGMLGGVLGSWQSEFLWSYYGSRGLFLCAALSLLAGWAWLLTLPNRAPIQARAVSDHQAHIWSHPGAGRLALAAWTFGLAVGSLFTFTTPFLHALGVSGISGLFAGLFLMSAAARVGCGYWLDRWGPRKVVAPCLGLLAGGSLLMAVLPFLAKARLTGFLLSGVCSGVGYGAIYPALQAQAYQSFPGRSRGAAVRRRSSHRSTEKLVDWNSEYPATLSSLLRQWLSWAIRDSFSGSVG
ncbi:MFS transporter [bacterium]|nr:MFS transporter [bacterium]